MTWCILCPSIVVRFIHVVESLNVQIHIVAVHDTQFAIMFAKVALLRVIVCLQCSHNYI